MNRKAQENTHAIAACAFEVREADGAIQIFPAGQFDAPRGAMAGKGPWRIDGAIASRLIASAATRSNPLVIDYEHQTLRASENGQPAPAAGWLAPDGFEWREGQGLYARTPEWTAAARRYIADREYRYLSPVFRYDPETGEVLDLLHVALTNAPAIDGMDALALAAATRIHPNEQPTHEEHAMKKLLEQFGLAPDASEEDALAALTQLQTEKSELQQQLEAAQAATAAAKAETPQTAVAAMSAMREELAALKSKVNGQEIDDLVTTAIADGKLVPAQEQWARDLGQSDLASLKAYIESATPIAALKGRQSDGKQLDGNTAALTEAEQEAARLLGKSEDEYLAAKG